MVRGSDNGRWYHSEGEIMGEAMIVRPREDWLEQIKKAQDEWEAMDPKPKTLDEFAEVNYEAFCHIVEGYYALGCSVSPELMKKAKMTSVNEALGIV